MKVPYIFDRAVTYYLYLQAQLALYIFHAGSKQQVWATSKLENWVMRDLPKQDLEARNDN
jgi:hypothetical protein